jgi:hypothetical protein
MNRWQSCWRGCLLAVVLAGPTAHLHAQPSPTFEKLVPDDAAFAFVLEHPQAASDAFQRTCPGQILGSAQWLAYRRFLREQDIFCALNLRPRLGLDWSDVVEADAPTLIMGIGGSLDGLGMLVAIDKERAEQELLPRVVEYFTSRGATQAKYPQSNDQGLRLTLPLSGDQKANEQVVVLHAANCLAIFSNQAFADAWLAFLAAEPPASPHNLEAPKHASHLAAGSARLMVNPSNAVDWLLQTDTSREKQGLLVSLRRQGIADLTRAVLELQMGELKAVDGAAVDRATVDMQLDWQLNHQSPWSKGMRLLAFAPSAIPVPASWIDASIAEWTSTSRDVPTWFEGIGSWFDERTDPEFPGAFEDVIDGLESDPEGPQIRVREEFVTCLGSQMTRVTWPRAKIVNEERRRQVFTIEIKDSAALGDVFDRYFAGDEVVEQGARNGMHYWHTRDGEALFMATGEADAVSPTAIAIGENTLFISDQWSTIESLIDQGEPDQPLEDSGRFQLAAKAIARLPDGGKAGMSITSAEEYVAEAYRDILPASQSTRAVSLSTELLGLLVAGANWRTQTTAMAALPSYDEHWLSEVSDMVTSVDADPEKLWGSTYLLRHNEESSDAP